MVQSQYCDFEGCDRHGLAISLHKYITETENQMLLVTRLRKRQVLQTLQFCAYFALQRMKMKTAKCLNKTDYKRKDIRYADKIVSNCVLSTNEQSMKLQNCDTN